MADLVLGLAKTTVEGTVTMARLAMAEEDKLKKSVQLDLLVISDEFEMMQAFLDDVKGRSTDDNLTRTMVRQVRTTALDFEDCIENIVHLDSKPHWWRRMMLPWCMPAAALGKDLDAVVANVEQLKARVGAMAQRRLLYNGINDNSRKPAEHQHAIATGAAKHSGQVDLITLINGKGGAEGGQARQGNNNDNDDAKEEEKDENAGNNNDDGKKEEDGKKDENAGNNNDDSKKEEEGQKDENAGNNNDDSKKEEEKDENAGNNNDDSKKEETDKNAGNNNDNSKKEEEKGKIEEATENETEEALKVISVLGTGSDLDMMFIKKAYDDSRICDNFKCRAWVKLVHPFNPIEFIRRLLSQFQKNACQGQGNTDKVLEAIVAPEDVLIEMLKTQIHKKYLVVLEDVSTVVDWETVKSYLPDNKDGSCIVVHTRQHGIALSCVGQQYPVELEMSLADHSVVRVIFKEGVAGKDSDVDTGDGNENKYEDWKVENPIYGREEDLQWLSRSLKCFYVVSVWGISGVGKSFLIEHFCQKVKEEEMKRRKNPGSASCKNREFVWVDVSRPFNIRGVRKRLELLKPCPKGSQNVEYIIVIDSLQSTDEWDLIKPVLQYTTRQKSDTCTSIRDTSRGKERTSFRDNVFFIIIITNEESVANYCAASVDDAVRNIKSLEADHATKLFDQEEKNSMYCWPNDEENEETRYQNEQTRKILLHKCGGFPNVICAVAESTRWRFCDIKVKDNLVTMLDANPQLTPPILKGIFSWLLAYFGSCPDSLKPCIFYLTIFPVNHTIRRRRLVRRWIVEGYTWDNKQITAEETANGFFSRLVKLSMIQPPPRGPRYLPSSSIMPLCQVNGFLREYVLSKSVEENFVFELQGNCKNLQRDPGTDNHYNMACVVQHLAIDKSWDRDRNVFESIDFSRLRSLTVFGRWESFLISHKMERLRVLDLEDVSAGLTNGDVEKMVKLLPRLKFLSLRGCGEITHLPSSLGDLKQLQTLDIRETSVINLPKSIIKLEKLQYIRAGTAVILDNDNTAGTFGSLPAVASAAAANQLMSATAMRKPRATLESRMSKFSIHSRLYDGPHNGINMLRGIGKLSSLHTLGVVNISAAGGEGIVDELKNLTLLHKLGVCGINRKISEKFISAISRLVHLESLSLQFQLNQDHEAAVRLAPMVKLRSLKLYGLADRLPTWIMLMCSRSQVPRLEKLDLQMRKLPQQQLDSIITLPHLWILRLRLAEFEDEEIRFGFSIPRNSTNGGWYFDFLEISCNSRLQAVRFASSVDVVILKIQCSSVSSSLQFFGLRAMKKLKEVWLSGSCGDALRKHLKEELDNNRNDTKPILRLEGNTSST